MDLDIKHQKNKFSFHIDNQEAFLDYSKIEEQQVWDFYHTFVPPELRHKQIGEKIVVFALNFAKEKRFLVIPSCPFVKKVIDNYPEFKDLIFKANR